MYNIRYNVHVHNISTTEQINNTNLFPRQREIRLIEKQCL